MKIGIDISQLAYESTGVANYLKQLVESLIQQDTENEYVLFFSSLRKNLQSSTINVTHTDKVTIRKFKFPPIFLDILWNKLHILPIENLIGPVDIFITSDWSEPPTKKARKGTILYDLIVYTYPQETDQKIIDTQKRKHSWMKKETDIIFCISRSTKKDAIDILGLDTNKLHVLYPGITL